VSFFRGEPAAFIFPEVMASASTPIFDMVPATLIGVEFSTVPTGPLRVMPP
jgi:hypothetical protein